MIFPSIEALTQAIIRASDLIMTTSCGSTIPTIDSLYAYRTLEDLKLKKLFYLTAKKHLELHSELVTLLEHALALDFDDSRFLITSEDQQIKVRQTFAAIVYSMLKD